VNGEVAHVGTPAELESELSSAYFGGAGGERPLGGQG
jgi:hypothetical protein